MFLTCSHFATAFCRICLFFFIFTCFHGGKFILILALVHTEIMENGFVSYSLFWFCEFSQSWCFGHFSYHLPLKAAEIPCFLVVLDHIFPRVSGKLSSGASVAEPPCHLDLRLMMTLLFSLNYTKAFVNFKVSP